MADPEQWSVAEGERRSQTEVKFKYTTLDGKEDVVSCRADHAIMRGVPQPTGLLAQLRLAEAERAAARASQATGCAGAAGQLERVRVQLHRRLLPELR